MEEACRCIGRLDAIEAGHGRVEGTIASRVELVLHKSMAGLVADLPFRYYRDGAVHRVPPQPDGLTDRPRHRDRHGRRPGGALDRRCGGRDRLGLGVHGHLDGPLATDDESGEAIDAHADLAGYLKGATN